MKKLYISFLAISIACVFFQSSCTKDRLIKDPGTASDTLTNFNGLIQINELMANGLTGEPDWIEIYNKSNNYIKLAAARTFFTDDLTNQVKFSLTTDQVVGPHSYTVVFCDGTGTVSDNIHTNFSLSSSGEQAGIYGRDSVGNLYLGDSISYPAQTVVGSSYGRENEGSDNWIQFAIPTPGAPN